MCLYSTYIYILKLFIFLKIFLICAIFKVFCWIFYNIASILRFVFFGHKACGILIPDQGLNLHPLQRKVKSQPVNHQGSPICNTHILNEIML